MSVIRVDNYLDAYRLRSQSGDLHEMAARPGKKAVTEFVNQQILDAIQPAEYDVLVDIGCGDATLLTMADRVAGECIGITGSIEEKLRLEAAFPAMLFLARQAQSLPLESSSVSKIVCNATLLYLPSEDDIRAALREMARVARPGATIWIGEMPEIDEYVYYGQYHGTSMLGFLWHLLRHNGMRPFLGMVRRWAKALVGNEQIVLNSARTFYANPEKMISMAKACGLSLKSYFRHKEPDEGGEVRDSRTRYDYVFTI